jgi:hypothetical protein
MREGLVGASHERTQAISTTLRHPHRRSVGAWERGSADASACAIAARACRPLTRHARRRLCGERVLGNFKDRRGAADMARNAGESDPSSVFSIRSSAAHARPSVHAKALGIVPAVTPITGERTTLPVVGTYGSWLLVRLPGRPNGHTGRISEQRTTASVTAWHLVIDTSTRRITVYHAGHVVRSMAAVVGKPSTPTPSGTYFVEESIVMDRAAVGAPLPTRTERTLQRPPRVRWRPGADCNPRSQERRWRPWHRRIPRLRQTGRPRDPMARANRGRRARHDYPLTVRALERGSRRLRTMLGPASTRRGASRLFGE